MKTFRIVGSGHAHSRVVVLGAGEYSQDSQRGRDLDSKYLEIAKKDLITSKAGKFRCTPETAPFNREWRLSVLGRGAGAGPAIVYVTTLQHDVSRREHCSVTFFFQLQS